MACHAFLRTTCSQPSAPAPYRKRVISAGFARSRSISESEAGRRLPIIAASAKTVSRADGLSNKAISFQLSADPVAHYYTAQCSTILLSRGGGARGGGDRRRASGVGVADSRGADDRRWTTLHRVRAQQPAARRVELARAANPRPADRARDAARSAGRLLRAYHALARADEPPDVP